MFFLVTRGLINMGPLETNIMARMLLVLMFRRRLTLPQVGTHADSLIAEAVIKGFRDFDLDTAYAAVYKDATVPPDNDWNTS